MKDTEDFKKHEFDCKCGCGLNRMSQSTVDMLQVARDWKEKLYPEMKSVRINCGTRCQKHNDSLPGSVKNSAHVPVKDGLTFAVDIDYDTDMELWALLICLGLAGFTRFGISKKGYLHVDNDKTKPNDIWKY